MTTRSDVYQLLQAVKQGSQARMTKSPMPVLSGVLLRRANAHIEVLSTNLEDVGAGSCPAFGDEETWEIVLPSSEWGRFAALPILDWLKAVDPPKPNKRGDNWLAAEMKVLPGAVDGIRFLEIQVERTKATFRGLDTQEFPLIPQEKIDEKLASEGVAPEHKKRKRLTPEEALARASEEAWQKALKQTKRMSAEDEIEHWQTWRVVLSEHESEIEKRLIHLAEVLGKQKQAEAEWQTECRKREDEEHQERLARLAWLEPLAESFRAEFNVTLRKDKHREMNSPIEAWPFYGDEDDAPTYPTSYHWLEAGWVWQGRLVIGRDKTARWHKHYFDTILGYEVNRYQIAYANLLDAKWREAHPITNLE